MLDKSQYHDVVVIGILPHLDNKELVALYNTSKELRSRVASFRNWKRKFHVMFPSDKYNDSTAAFEQFIRRCNASIQLLGSTSSAPHPMGIISDIVASRFLIGALCQSGEVWIGPQWQKVPDFSATKLWAGSDHLYALSDGQLYMWKFLDMSPSRVELARENLLQNAQIVRYGTFIHAAYIPGKGILRWRHTVEQSTSSEFIGHYGEIPVQDILTLRMGVLVLTTESLDYWSGMDTSPQRLALGRNHTFTQLRLEDEILNTVSLIANDGACRLLSLSGSVSGFGLQRALQLAKWLFYQPNTASSPKFIKMVESINASAALVIGDFKC